MERRAFQMEECMGKWKLLSKVVTCSEHGGKCRETGVRVGGKNGSEAGKTGGIRLQMTLYVH